jgi:hypothetical protein
MPQQSFTGAGSEVAAGSELCAQGRSLVTSVAQPDSGVQGRRSWGGAPILP